MSKTITTKDKIICIICGILAISCIIAACTWDHSISTIPDTSSEAHTSSAGSYSITSSDGTTIEKNIELISSSELCDRYIDNIAIQERYCS